eukprot:7287269-Ditylum_brightwellii.AAC.1
MGAVAAPRERVEGREASWRASVHNLQHPHASVLLHRQPRCFGERPPSGTQPNSGASAVGAWRAWVRERLRLWGLKKLRSCYTGDRMIRPITAGR